MQEPMQRPESPEPTSQASLRLPATAHNDGGIGSDRPQCRTSVRVAAILSRCIVSRARLATQVAAVRIAWCLVGVTDNLHLAAGRHGGSEGCARCAER